VELLGGGVVVELLGGGVLVELLGGGVVVELVGGAAIVVVSGAVVELVGGVVVDVVCLWQPGCVQFLLVKPIAAWSIGLAFNWSDTWQAMQFSNRTSIGCGTGCARGLPVGAVRPQAATGRIISTMANKISSFLFMLVS
jgi:hypothetical protein